MPYPLWKNSGKSGQKKKGEGKVLEGKKAVRHGEKGPLALARRGNPFERRRRPTWGGKGDAPPKRPTSQKGRTGRKPSPKGREHRPFGEKTVDLRRSKREKTLTRGER